MFTFYTMKVFVIKVFLQRTSKQPSLKGVYNFTLSNTSFKANFNRRNFDSVNWPLDRVLTEVCLRIVIYHVLHANIKQSYNPRTDEHISLSSFIFLCVRRKLTSFSLTRKLVQCQLFSKKARSCERLSRKPDK